MFRVAGASAETPFVEVALEETPPSLIRVKVKKPLGVGLEEVEHARPRGVTVAAVMEGSNGEACGIQEGYFLVSVNGIDVQEKDFDAIMDTIGDADESKSLDLVFTELPPGAKELFPLSPNSNGLNDGDEKQEEEEGPRPTSATPAATTSSHTHTHTQGIVVYKEEREDQGEEVAQVVSPKRKYRVVLDKLPLLFLPAGATKCASSLVEVSDGRHVDFGSIVYVSLLLHRGKQVYAEFCHEFEGADHAPTGWLLAQDGEHLNISCDEFVVQVKTPPPPVTPPRKVDGKIPAPVKFRVGEEEDEEEEEVDYSEDARATSGGSVFDNFDLSNIFACCNLVVAKPATQEETQLQNKKLAEEYEHMKFLKTEKKKKAKREEKEKQKRRAAEAIKDDDTSFASWDPNA